MRASASAKSFACNVKFHLAPLYGYEQINGLTFSSLRGVLMRYSVYLDNQGYWRWTLYAANHRIIADSGEGYHNQTDCLAGIDLVKASYDAPVVFT